ncbi:MAG TPA: type II secretion system F family protein [Devosiaceae bacterium]|jgi:tight adherence protein B|nr:type II secretion system F family protein [Devosiaceae bacterium]
MSPLIYVLLAVIAIGAAGFALVPSALGSNRAEKRKRALQGDIQANRRENSALRDRDARRKNVQAALKQQTDALAARKRVSLQSLIFQAGMKIKGRDFIRNQVIFGAIVAVIVFVVQVPIYYAVIFGGAAGYVLPRWYLSRRRKQYQNKFLDELPNAVEAIVRGVKSGLPLNDSIRLVSKEAKEPVKSEFGRVLDQQAVGKSMGEAVTVLLDRVPVPEVNFFIVVITVQQQAGGNLSEALGNLARVLRNRKALKLKIAAMSSEAKASAGIIGSLPFVVSLLVSLTSPTYLLPLVQTTTGQLWLGIAGLMLAMGVFVMRRMVIFEY